MDAFVVHDDEAARFPPDVGFEAIVKGHAQNEGYACRGYRKGHARAKRANIYMSADKVGAIRVISVGK